MLSTSTMATSSATRTGWLNAGMMTAVPIRIRDVTCAAAAASTSGLGSVPYSATRCSPRKISSKPTSSATRNCSRLSWYTWWADFPAGC